MHEREKSDPAIGAGKPTNKAEASAHAEHGVSDAAELVEQRAGAKGNADEQSTHRTQGRERVSQALERVRKAARLKKDEKFTALLHHINLDLLHLQRELHAFRAEPQPNAARRTGFGKSLEHALDGGDDSFVRVEEHLAVLIAPDKANRQAAPELAACRLIANAAVEAGA